MNIVKASFLFFCVIWIANCSFKIPNERTDDNIEVEINSFLKKRLKDKDISEIVHRWRDYLNFIRKNNQEYVNYKYWDGKGKLALDLDVYAIAAKTDNFKSAPLIIGIQKKDGFYILKTLFRNVDGVTTDLISIFNVIVSKQGDDWILSDFHSYYTQDWTSKTSGTITYRFKENHQFNLELAEEMNLYNDTFSSFFNSSVKDVTYYIYENSQERATAMGYNFNGYMYNDYQESGEADLTNGLIHAGNGKELYVHELVHLYTSSHYYTMHRWFDEGLAVYLDEQQKGIHEASLAIIAEHAALNPSYNFNDLLSLPDTIGRKTSLMYDISGLLVRRILERQPSEGLQALLNSGVSDDSFYRVVEEQLNIRQEDLDGFVRNELKSYENTKF